MVSGEQLAELIRFQYPFAMIDEFKIRMRCGIKFSRKFIVMKARLVMLAYDDRDPKRAIYRFRGADIFTYLKQQTKRTSVLTLGTNYRSSHL